MKYYLILGLLVQKYRESMDISIHSDNTLIDQLQVDQSLSQHIPHYVLEDKSVTEFNQKYKDLIPLKELLDGQLQEPLMHSLNIPEKLFVYEIDGSVLGKEITLTVNDQNSNYTNGFMTKSNLFQICHSILIPKILLDKSNWTRIRKIFEKAQKYRTSAERNDHDVEVNTLHWPVTRFYKFQDGRTEKHWVGGKNKVVLPLFKKFGTHMIWLGTGRPRIRFNTDFVYIDRVFNLLNTLNEDQ